MNLRHMSPGRGGGIFAPSFGTYCEKDPGSGGGDSRNRRMVTLNFWSGRPSLKGHALTLWPLKQDMKGLT